MGRWAQRQRNGGGINSPAVMTDALRTDTHTIVVTFDRYIDAEAFRFDNWTPVPGGQVPDTINQFSDTQLEILWPAVISANTSLQFAGHVANVVTPQEVPIHT